MGLGTNLLIVCGSVKESQKATSSLVLSVQVVFSQAPILVAFSNMDDVTPVQSLTARLLQIRLEERAAKLALNAELRATKHRRESRSSTGFTHLEENIALSLVVKQQSTYNAAATYFGRMQDQSHHKFLEPRSREELIQVLGARFEALPHHHVQLLTNPVGAYWLKVSVAADKFIDEFKLRAWIIEQNVLKGLAPPSSEVGTFYDEAIIANHGIPILPPSRADMQLAKNRSWIYRYRGRWGISIGKVNTRDIVEPLEIHQKVGISQNLVGSALFVIFCDKYCFLMKKSIF